MEKQRSKRKARPPVRQFWAERGFNPSIADSRPQPNEDPCGEAAYQRAFYDAEKANPPRVPNPSQFLNSPSARAYMARRNKDYSTPRDTNQQSTSNNPGSGNLDRSPTMVGRQSSSVSPSSYYSSSAIPPFQPTNSTPRMAEGTWSDYTMAPISPSTDPPSALVALEPFGAPRGPSNPFAFGR